MHTIKLKQAKKRLHEKIRSTVDNFRCRAVKGLYLTGNTLNYPHLETKRLTCNTAGWLLPKKAVWKTMQLRHYRLRTRLASKAGHTRGFADDGAFEVDTARGCTMCDAKNQIGASETCRCKSCGYRGRRNVAAARNVFPVNMLPGYLQGRGGNLTVRQVPARCRAPSWRSRPV